MAAAIESQVQFERDLRSAHQDYKRTKDSQSKWSNGARPLAGCRLDWTTLEAVGGTEQQRAKTRPRGKNSETYVCHSHILMRYIRVANSDMRDAALTTRRRSTT